MKSIIIIICIHLSYYAIGAMATTNIMRLLKGETTKQNYPHCHCGNCNHIIPVYHQIPVISYLVSGGKCRYCGVKIPIMNTCLELVVFLAMSIITAAFRYSPIGVLISFIAYETICVVLLIKYGHREENFISEYIVSLLYLLAALVLVEFMSLLYITP